MHAFASAKFAASRPPNPRADYLVIRLRVLPRRSYREDFTMTQPIGNWRCVFWHRWRYYYWIKKDVCVREGCGEMRAHQEGTRDAEERRR